MPRLWERAGDEATDRHQPVVAHSRGRRWGRGVRDPTPPGARRGGGRRVGHHPVVQPSVPPRAPRAHGPIAARRRTDRRRLSDREGRRGVDLAGPGGLEGRLPSRSSPQQRRALVEQPAERADDPRSSPGGVARDARPRPRRVSPSPVGSFRSAGGRRHDAVGVRPRDGDRTPRRRPGSGPGGQRAAVRVSRCAEEFDRRPGQAQAPAVPVPGDHGSPQEPPRVAGGLREGGRRA